MSQKQEYLTWAKFDLACDQIAEKIKKLGTINSVYGIPRGGLVLAVKLSHLLNLKLITNETGITEKTLVVDDIADTGNTLQKLLKLYCEPKGFKPLIATLYYHQKTKITPDVWIFEKKNAWIVFPWETSFPH